MYIFFFSDVNKVSKYLFVFAIKYITYLLTVSFNVSINFLIETSKVVSILLFILYILLYYLFYIFY